MVFQVLILLKMVNSILIIMLKLLLLRYPFIYVLDEFSDPLQIIFRIFFDIVMTGHFDEIRREVFVNNILPKSISVAYVYNFVTLPVTDVYGAIEVFDAINIRKFVKAKRPS